MIKVTLLGTGTPTSPTRFQSGVLIEIGEDKLLFDAGRGTVHQLYQTGIDIGRINPVFITHHHFDHINDLFDVMISTAMQGRVAPLNIYGPAGTQRIVSALLNEVYAQDIRFRLEEDKALRKLGGVWGEKPESIAHVDVAEVVGGVVLETANYTVSAEKVVHGLFPDAPDFNWQCLGYRVETADKVITISGDTVPCDGLRTLAQEADLLIQCCHMPKAAVANPVMAYLTDAILPSSGQVGALAQAAHVKHMVLTHLGTLVTPERHAEMLADVRADFSGRVTLGYDLMEIELKWARRPNGPDAPTGRLYGLVGLFKGA